MAKAPMARAYVPWGMILGGGRATRHAPLFLIHTRNGEEITGFEAGPAD